MHKNNFLIYSGLAILLLGLSSCRNQTPLIKYSKLPSIRKSDGFYQKKDDVSVSARVLSYAESQSYFGVDLISYGYTPIQLIIENESMDTLVIRPSYIGLPLADPQQIAKILHWDTSTYVSLGSIFSLMFFWPALFWVGNSGYNMHTENKKTNETVDSISLNQNSVIKIRPYEDFNKVIFIDRNLFMPQFIFKLLNKDKKKLLCFNVKL